MSSTKINTTLGFSVAGATATRPPQRKTIASRSAAQVGPTRKADGTTGMDITPANLESPPTVAIPSRAREGGACCPQRAAVGPLSRQPLGDKRLHLQLHRPTWRPVKGQAITARLRESRS